MYNTFVYTRFFKQIAGEQYDSALYESINHYYYYHYLTICLDI